MPRFSVWDPNGLGDKVEYPKVHVFDRVDLEGRIDDDTLGWWGRSRKTAPEEDYLSTLVRDFVYSKKCIDRCSTDIVSTVPFRTLFTPRNQKNRRQVGEWFTLVLKAFLNQNGTFDDVFGTENTSLFVGVKGNREGMYELAAGFGLGSMQFSKIDDAPIKRFMDTLNKNSNKYSFGKTGNVFKKATTEDFQKVQNGDIIPDFQDATDKFGLGGACLVYGWAPMLLAQLSQEVAASTYNDCTITDIELWARNMQAAPAANFKLTGTSTCSSQCANL